MSLLGKCVKFIRVSFYKLIAGPGLKASYKQRLWERGIRFDIEKGGHVDISEKVWIRKDAQLWCTKGANLSIGKNVFINTGTIISARNSISIGDNTIIGPNVLIYDHDHDFKNNLKGFIEGSVTIGNNVWIGGNVSILKNVTIGDNSVIGAGTVVSKDVPANSLATSGRELIIKELK